MTIGSYEIIFWILLILAFWHYLRNNDEFLFLPVLFFFFTGIERYHSVTEGEAHWVKVAYSYNIFSSMTDEKAIYAMGLFALGTILFFFSYKFYHNRLPWPGYARDNNDIFRNFLKQKKGLILAFFIFYTILFSFTRQFIGGAVALGQSYFLLLPMALGGFVLLAFLVFRSYSWQENTSAKLLYLGLMIYAIIMSYVPGQRFQFLSWMVALGIIITQQNTPKQKIKYYIGGGITVLFFFALAGVMRHTNIENLSFSERWELAMERTDSSEDQNMLDGFMMVLDVYPEHLDYHYGGEHFEILLRPIPRAFWPGKPLGGYANKLGLNDPSKGTVGISQTIYGTFYGEGGIWGIIILSLLYGYIFVRLFRYTYRYNSDMHWLLKGIIIASFVPILRGGDLPGIIAFIGMSYWPVFIFLYLYNKHLKYNVIYNYTENEEAIPPEDEEPPAHNTQ